MIIAVGSFILILFSLLRAVKMDSEQTVKYYPA